jgi:hypothetical protein
MVRNASLDQQAIQHKSPDVHRDDLIEFRYPLAVITYIPKTKSSNPRFSFETKKKSIENLRMKSLVSMLSNVPETT